jgi:ABC-type methionine transport system ATPase subunit
MLDKEFKYYLDHQHELVKEYNNRFLVIVDGRVVGDYDSVEQAMFKSAKKYEVGKFLIQECTEGDKAYTQTFHSRAIFY